MKKKLIALILIFLISFSLPVSAYQINDYEMHHEAGMLISLDTEDILYEKNADQKMYPAALTTLMTALVMIDNIDNLDNTYIKYSKTANNRILGTGAVVLSLKVDEEIKAKDALAALLIASCGDVAYAIAEHIGGSIEGFVDLMNKKAVELGLKGTHFTNPIGLHSDDHYSTARDIYLLSKVAFNNNLIKEFTSATRYTLEKTNMSDERVIVTSNLLISRNSSAFYSYADYGKTGFTTEAKRCIVSVASYANYTYMAIVLGAPTSGGVRYDCVDTANMYRWAFNNFRFQTLFEGSTPVAEAPVELSAETDHIALSFENGLKVLLPKGADASTISYKINLNKESFDAPIKKGEVLGTTDIYYAEEKLGTLNLVATQNVKANATLVLLRGLRNFFTSGFMKAIYILVALGAVVFIGFVIKLNKTKPKRRKVKYIPLTKEELDQND